MHAQEKQSRGNSKKSGILQMFKSRNRKKEDKSGEEKRNPDGFSAENSNNEECVRHRSLLTSVSQVDFTEKLSPPQQACKWSALASGSESCLNYVRALNLDTAATCHHQATISTPCRACMKLPPLPPGAELMFLEKARLEKDRIRTEKKNKATSTGLTYGLVTENKLENRNWIPTKTSTENIYEEIPVGTPVYHIPADNIAPQVHHLLGSVSVNSSKEPPHIPSVRNSNPVVFSCSNNGFSGSTKLPYHVSNHGFGDTRLYGPYTTRGARPLQRQVTTMNNQVSHLQMPTPLHTLMHSPAHPPQPLAARTSSEHKVFPGGYSFHAAQTSRFYSLHRHVNSGDLVNRAPNSRRASLPPPNYFPPCSISTSNEHVFPKSNGNNSHQSLLNLTLGPANGQIPRPSRTSEGYYPKISKQVSLGNLDFELAKEYNGFLLVPLRYPAVTEKSEMLQLNPQIYEQADQTKESQLANNGSTQVTCSKLAMNTIQTIQPSDVVTQRTENVNRTTECPSLHDQTCSVGIAEGNSRVMQSGGKFAYNSSAASCKENNYSHCKRCKRPHTIYKGIVQCHSDVEDIRHELQYLDIAGLDPKVMRSDSMLLREFGHRRSAFSRYTPDQPASLSPAEVENFDVIPQCQGKSTTDSQRRQSPSTESDYFSSNYTTSLSDTLSKGSIIQYVVGSDHSNDTFSEYDMNGNGKSAGDGHEDYSFILEKVKDNFKRAEEVKRIIRDSESEPGTQSDTNITNECHSQECVEDDTISLTSITSLSEPSEEQFSRHAESRKHFVKNIASFEHANLKQNYKGRGISDTVHSFTRLRKPIRKKKKARDGNPEYYRLPSFPSVLPVDTLSQTPAQETTDASLHISVGGCMEGTKIWDSQEPMLVFTDETCDVVKQVPSPQNVQATSNILPKTHVIYSPDLDTSDPTGQDFYFNKQNNLQKNQSVHDKLSCRVSSLTVSDISLLRKHNQKSQQSGPTTSKQSGVVINRQPGSNKPGQVETKHAPLPSASVHDEGDLSPRTSSQPVPNVQSPNQLLTDLLRRNHDRQHLI